MTWGLMHQFKYLPSLWKINKYFFQLLKKLFIYFVEKLLRLLFTAIVYAHSAVELIPSFWQVYYTKNGFVWVVASQIIFIIIFFFSQKSMNLRNKMCFDGKNYTPVFLQREKHGHQ